MGQRPQAAGALNGGPRRCCPANGSRVTQYNTYWGEISAAGFMACVPIVIFAFIVQKHLVRGLSLGAIKG